jgi:uncharacterized protein YciI
MPEFLYRIQPTRLTMLTDAPTPAEAAAIAAHRAYLDRMAAAGVVLLFGRTQTTDASTFGIVIFRAESAEAARRIMAADPAVAAGVMRGEVFPFRVAGVGPGHASPV